MVIEFWTVKKKKLEQCHQYVLFEQSAKQVNNIDGGKDDDCDDDADDDDFDGIGGVGDHKIMNIHVILLLMKYGHGPKATLIPS